MKLISSEVKLLEKKKNKLINEISSLGKTRAVKVKELNQQIFQAQSELNKLLKQINTSKKQLRTINEVISEKIEKTEKYCKEITENSIEMANRRMKVAENLSGSFLPKKEDNS